MASSSEIKEYRIDFYQLTMMPTANYESVWDILEAIKDSTLRSILSHSGFTRDLWRLKARNAPNPVSFVGQFRKFRDTDIPEKGAAGRQATEIVLEDDEGIVEKNFFVYYRKQQLLGWHNNGHASSAKQFADFLRRLADVGSVSCAPLIQTDALRRLMKGDVTLKQIEFTIPRPTSPDMYPDDDFSQSILQMMSNGFADSLHLKMGINLRRGGGRGQLSNVLKTTLAELSNLGATTAKAQVFEDGVQHPIDLIADRIIAYKEVETGAKFPPANTMYNLIDAARSEWEDEINGYLGSMRENTA